MDKLLVTFIPNKKLPLHNWYYYKEGYARGLVQYFIKKWNIGTTDTVLDPFCGVGTTPLTCRQNRIPSIGFDVSPLTVLISQVKTNQYTISELEKSVKQALAWKTSSVSIPSDKFLKRAMPRRNLEQIIFYREKIKEVTDRESQHFLLLALIDSSFRCSYLRKDGSVIKIKKRPCPPVGKMFKYKIRRMLRELKTAKLPDVDCSVSIGDARDIKLPDNSVDFVITSPPYLNKIEYTNIYKFEYSLFFDRPVSKIRSFTGGQAKTTDEICTSYFDDMQRVLEELFRVCKLGAKLAIVIGGGCFPDRAVLVDEKLAELARTVGFKVSEILVARNSWCTRRRTEKVGQIRESVVCLEKP